MSDKNVRALFADSTSFTREMASAHWLEDEGVSVSTSNPSDLFAADIENRPLVVGLFGGTGVGKSSLLNRLAGSEIARTGVVRPTSMEITAYLHQDLNLVSLPTGFPQQQFSEARHDRDQFADVMWVDMPDFDSDEVQNRAQVTQWLPHIDVLLYVVTPERYKDEQGWRMLLDRGYRHGWLFVMNQWDRAEDVQREDFIRLLSGAGFQDPLLFRTICNNTENPDDDFTELSTLVSNLAERNIIEQLDQRGWLQRLSTAGARLKKQIALLSSAESEMTLRQSFEQRWDDFSAQCAANLDLPIKEFSLQFEDKKTAPMISMLKSVTGRDSKSQALDQVARRTEAASLWDDWSATRLADTISEYESAQAEHGVPDARISRLMSGLENEASAHVTSQLQSHLSEALTNPGTSLQRLSARVIKVLQILLPVAALLWIGYRVVHGFVNGAEDASTYVGMDFLVNGLIMAVLAWLVPWLAGRFLVPSIPQSVTLGLHQGLSAGLSITADEFATRLDQVSHERNQLLQRAVELQKSINGISERSVVLENPELAKMLLPHPAVA